MGDSPKITWTLPTSASTSNLVPVQQTVSVQSVELRQKPVVNSKLKKTVAVGSAPVIDQSPQQPQVLPEIKESKPIPVIFWLLSAIAGLTTGFLLNIFI